MINPALRPDVESNVRKIPKWVDKTDVGIGIVGDEIDKKLACNTRLCSKFRRHKPGKALQAMHAATIHVDDNREFTPLGIIGFEPQRPECRVGKGLTG